MGSFWSQPIRVENTEHFQLITCRTINSALWFVNNKPLENRILAYLAKYAKKYDIELIAFCIVGNHYHMVARFPLGNRSAFFKDFNARIAEAVRYYVDGFLGGPLFGQRFTPQYLPLDKDVEKYFFYSALQPVSSGLCDKVSDSDSYNSFHDAIHGIKRKFKLFNYGKYNAARRHNPYISREDFTEIHELNYKRLPGFEALDPKVYVKKQLEALEERRVKLVQERVARGKSFLGKKMLRRVKPGSLPMNTKKGGIRPIVLSVCGDARKQMLDWYFSMVERYKRAVEKYRQGNYSVSFPPGTYRPSGLCMVDT